MPHPNNSRKTRRCYWYTDDGRPLPNQLVQKGCPSGASCGFAHPDDPQWTHASSSRPAGEARRPSISGARSPSPLRPQAPASIYGPRPSPSGPPPPAPPVEAPTNANAHARPHAPPGLPPKPGPSLLERVASASSVIGSDRDREDKGSSRTRPRDSSPIDSIASSSDPRVLRRVSSGAGTMPPPDRRREEDRYRDRDRREDERRRDDDRRRGDDRRYEDAERGRSRRDVDDDRKRDEGRDRDRDRDHRRREEERRSRSRQRSSKSRDHRSKSTHRRSRSRSRMRRESNATAAPRREPSEEEKRQVWMERIKLLSESVAARTDLLRLKQEVQTYEQMTKSSKWEIVPEDARKAMVEAIAVKKQQLQEKEAQIKSALARLIPTDYYPFVQSPSQQYNDAAMLEMNNSLDHLRRDVDALFDTVSKLQAATVSLQAQPSIAPIAPASTPEAGEVAESSTRPKKRRRLSVDDGSSQANAAEPNADDVERLKDMYVALEGRVAELGNDIQQYDSRVEDEVDGQLDYLGLTRLKGAGGATNEELTECVEKLNGEVAGARARQDEVTAGLAQLSLDGQKQEAETAHLKTENERLRAQVEEMQAQQKEMSEGLQQRTEQLEALRAAVTAFISQPPQPPPPEPPSTATIAAAVRPRLLRDVHDSLQPLLNDLHTQIDKLLRDQLNDVNGALMSQIMPAIQSVEAIAAWAEKMKPPQANGAISNVVAPSSSSDKGKEIARPL
ncbi:hypothetical protein C8Q80DRAFT_732557 [Daedaleopsis nitida]|nr:hypothetical protein C8Q80DRAFT_732557 [Daedaleopsis nitida]